MDLQLRQRAWLDAFRDTPTIGHACRKTNTTRAEVREWEKDEDFAQDKADIELDANDKLEEHMLNIAMGKMKRPILDKTGKQVTVSSEDGTLVEPGWEIVRSDAITIAVAKARMPEKYADIANIDLTKLTQAELKALQGAVGARK